MLLGWVYSFRSPECLRKKFRIPGAFFAFLWDSVWPWCWSCSCLFYHFYNLTFFAETDLTLLTWRVDSFFSYPSHQLQIVLPRSYMSSPLFSILFSTVFFRSLRSLHTSLLTVKIQLFLIACLWPFYACFSPWSMGSAGCVWLLCEHWFSVLVRSGVLMLCGL